MTSIHTVDKYGDQYWTNEEGQYHRDDDLPAVIWENGYQVWCQNGLYHRLDGPAVIWANGSQEWFQHDLRHRLDGPAIIWENGEQEWYVNDVEISEKVIAERMG